MLEFVAQQLIQAQDPIGPSSWGNLCLYWRWAFWLAFAIGLVGAITLFFRKPTSG